MSTHNIYLLDTCTCIALLKKNPTVIQRLREIGTHNCKISDVTIAELYFGAFKSGKEKHFNDVSIISNLFEKFPIQYNRKYGEIRWELEKRGLRIGDMDMFIAATALEESAILVSGNIKHFERIPGLEIENWMAD